MKVNIEIEIENPKARVNFSKDFINSENNSDFVIIPKSEGFNLSPDIIDFLISFSQSVSIKFIIYFASKIFKSFKRDNLKIIKIKIGGNEVIEIESNMSEETIQEILKNTLKNDFRNIQ